MARTAKTTFQARFSRYWTFAGPLAGDEEFRKGADTLRGVSVHEVAVGTIIADRPPHRSARALISACGSYLG